MTSCSWLAAAIEADYRRGNTTYIARPAGERRLQQSTTRMLHGNNESLDIDGVAPAEAQGIVYSGGLFGSALWLQQDNQLLFGNHPNSVYGTTLLLAGTWLTSSYISTAS